MTRQVPTLSLKSYTHGTKSEKKCFIDDIFLGLKEYGFIILKDHSLEQDLIDKTYVEIENFFKLQTSIKEQYGNIVGGQRGYTKFGQEHAKDSDFPDLKEFWHTGRDQFIDQLIKDKYPQNIWPDELLPNFKTYQSEVYLKLEQISHILLESIGKSLEVGDDFFKDMITDGNSILRSIHYPNVEGMDTVNSVRASAHEDINLITLLVGATASGLQLLDRDGKWLDVNNNPGEIIVDTGDMMSRLTNDVLPSTTHRVINPDCEKSSRFSMPYFVHPHSEASLKCIKNCLNDGARYEEITAGEYLNQRLKEIGLL